MRIFKDSDEEIAVRWYFVPDDTPFLPGGTVYASGNWASNRSDWQGPGEVAGAPRVWVDGSKPFVAPLGQPAGPAEWFENGAPADAPPIGYNVAKVPLPCVAPTPPLGPKVLLWVPDNVDPEYDYDYFDFIGNLVANGIGWSFPFNWSGNLGDYRLILFQDPVSFPSWWSYAMGGSWKGRIVFSGVSDDPFYTTNAFINSSLAPLNGMSIVPDDVFPLTSTTAALESNALNVGSGPLYMQHVSQVAGGAPLAKEFGTGKVLIARAPLSPLVDSVLLGSEFCVGDLPGAGTPNEVWWNNLYAVPPEA